jgi:hypothetical protein
MSYKNRKSILKLYNTLSINLKDDEIENLSICIIYPFKTGFKIFKEIVIFKIFLWFFISDHAIFVKFFSVGLGY